MGADGSLTGAREPPQGTGGPHKVLGAPTRHWGPPQGTGGASRGPPQGTGEPPQGTGALQVGTWLFYSIHVRQHSRESTSKLLT